MFGSHFYHETIRRAVSVFGTLFNNINIIRRDAAGNVKNIVKVPLAYGPRQKFISRIEQQNDLSDPKVAIKLPRLSFELVSLSYDSNTKMQKGMRQTITSVAADGETYRKKTILGPVGYRMGIQLNVMAKNQDDALQILEQILPFFQPDYTVTVKQVNDNFRSDMPFILQSVSISDEYEGDYISPRVIVYTLDFETRVRFYGEIGDSGVIRRTTADIRNLNDGTLQERQAIILNPFDSNPDSDFGLDVSYTFGSIPDEYILTITNINNVEVGDVLIGLTSGAVGQVTEIVGGTAKIYKPDGSFIVLEELSVKNKTFDEVLSIVEAQEIWYE
jgi:hypothetical protein